MHAHLIPRSSLASSLSFCSLFILIYSVIYPIFLALVFLSRLKSFLETGKFSRNGLKTVS